MRQSEESINIVVNQLSTYIGSISNNNIKLPIIINLGICARYAVFSSISNCRSIALMPVFAFHIV